ncbi:uncharacterized protein LOC143274879 isoform X2 [Babylonia areolata]
MEGYSNQVMVALVGAAVFHGTFYSQCHIVQLRIEYLVTGPEVAQGVAMFINSVMMDVEAMLNSRTHTLLGMNIPVDVGGEEWDAEFWEPRQIQDEKAQLLQAMSNAVAASKYILAECVFQKDPTEKKYVRGQKQYCLNFVTVVEDSLKEEGLLSFAEYPMGSLHEGVFLNRTQAEAYVNVFSPQTSYADTQNVVRAPEAPARRSSVLPQDGSLKRPSMIYEDDRYLVHRHVHARMELLKPTKIRIDGFRIGDDSGFGPFAWQITSPIKSNLQSRITGFHPQAQLFDIVYHTLLLLLMDRSSYDPTLTHELYRLCHSTAGRLHMLNEMNKSLRAIIRGFAEKDDMQLVRPLLKQYRDSVDELLAHSLQERSTELIMVGRAMTAEITRLLAPTDRDFSSLTHVDHIVATLRNIQHFSMPLLLQLSEDAIYWCPQLKELITKFHETFPEDVLRPRTRHKQDDNYDFVGGQESGADYKHGMEDERIMNHEFQVIDVEICKEKDTAPKIMATESVLLKYMTDTHLDEVWHKFLVGLLADIQLLPNPYPRFLSTMRGCTVRMDVCYEKESALQERLVAMSAQLVDMDNYIYQLPGCQAFGPQPSLSMVDAGAFVPVLTRIEEYLVNKSYIHRKGPYRVGVCLGMSAPSSLYGKVMPYLHSVELQEHYYIQGPAGCQASATQLFGRMVQAHMADLIETAYFPIVGVIMGHEKVRWSWDSIVNKRHGFWLELEMTCARKEPIYMKAYIQMDGWRYLMVRKHFLLHFISEDTMENSRFYEYSPISFYETFFFSKERAAFHYQNDGVPRGGNPCSGPNCQTVGQLLDDQILRARDQADWFLALRYILLKAVMNKDQEGKAAAEAWRLNNSMAGQAAYTAVLCESLQDLTMLALEYNRYATTDNQEEEGSVAEGYQSAGPAWDSPNPLDMEVVHKMAAAFLQKARGVVEWRVSMQAWSLGDYMGGKLKAVVEKDPHSREVFLAVEQETMDILEETKQMLMAVAVMISGDVALVSPHAQAAIKAAEQQRTHRPSSVSSDYLADPDLYRRSRPKANKKIVDDDMLYAFTK